MKRLVDETTDEFTRSLLVAGIEDRPAPGNKAQVIAALGAGSAVGLFSSNAFAWFGTTAGKLTAVSVTVGVAGALLVAVPQLRSEGVAGPKASAHLQAPASAGSAFDTSARAALPGSAAVASGGPIDRGAADPELVADGDSNVAASAEAGGRGATSEPLSESPTSAERGPGIKAATKKLSAWRERRLAARRRASSQTASSQSAARQNASERRASSGEASEVASGSASAEGAAAEPLAQEKTDLDFEVRLVDDMHWAARRNDRDALGRFVEQYRATFPDGQLKSEVAQFASRLEQSGTPPTP